MEYTQYDVIQEFKKLFLISKDKKNQIIERRSYLIGILYYKFKLSEQEIFSYTNLLSRSAINYTKKIAIDRLRIGDPRFIDNVSDLIEKFPFDFTEACGKVVHYTHSTVEVTIKLNYKNYARLNRYMKAKKITEDNLAVQQLLLTTLKLWEE